MDKIHQLEKHSLLLKAQILDMEQEKEADTRRLKELQEENLSLCLAQRRSMEESQRLGWELEQLSRSTDTPHGQQSLSEEVSERTRSQILKLQKDNQSLLRTIKELRGKTQTKHEPHLVCNIDNFASSAGDSSTSLHNSERKVQRLEAEIQELEAENQVLQASLEELRISARRLEQLETEKQHLEHEGTTLERDKRQLEKENRRLRQQVEIQEANLDSRNVSVASLEREMRSLMKELEASRETSERVKSLERDKRDLNKQAAIDQKTLAALREELVCEKLKTLQRDNDQEKLTHELEMRLLNQESTQQETADNRRFRMLESELDCFRSIWKVSRGHQAQILTLQRQAASLQETNTALQTCNTNLQVEKSTLNSQSASLSAHNAQLQQQQAGMEAERDSAVQTRDELRGAHEQLLRDHERLAALMGKHACLKKAHRTLELEHRTLQDRYSSLLQQRTKLEELEKTLKEEQMRIVVEKEQHQTTSAECRRLSDEKEWLNQTSILSFLHHPNTSTTTTLPSVTVADTVPDVSELWVTDKESNGSTVPSGCEDSDELQNHGLKGVQSRAQSQSSGEFSVSLENEPWSNGSSPVQQPQSRSSSFHHPPSDASTPQRPTNLQQQKEKASAVPTPSSQTLDARSVQRQKDPVLPQDFWLTRGTKTIRRGSQAKVARRSSDSGRVCKINSELNGINVKDATPRASACSPVTVLYVQGKSSSMSGCLNCFSTPLVKEGPLKEFRTPKSLPRASSVISTAEGSSRRSSVSSECRVTVKSEPLQISEESQSQKQDSSSRTSDPEPIPPLKPPRDPAVVILSQHHKSPVQESLLGSSFTFNSVFSNTIFSDSEVTTTTSRDVIHVGQNLSPLESQDPFGKKPQTLTGCESDAKQNTDRSSGLERKSRLLSAP
uniref:Coiled-coil domain containing 88A n=1 Tax=Nothobranchius pienaari TaxID=704102 RepID=A0A1A8M508_9TELE